MKSLHLSQNGLYVPFLFVFSLVFVFTEVFSQTCTPSTPVCVPANGYAFQFANDTDFGLLFNATDGEYQFTNGSGVGLFKIAAVSGNVTAKGNMQIDGSLWLGLGNPQAGVQFSVFDGLAQFGVASGYAQFDDNGDLEFIGSSDYLVSGNRYAFRYKGDENFGLYFNQSTNAYDFTTFDASPVFTIGSLSGNISNTGTASIGSVSKNNSLEQFLVRDSISGLIQFRDLASLVSGTEIDPQVGANALDKAPKWNGSSLVAGSLSMNATVATGANATATGTNSIASGDASTAMGLNTTASGSAGTALGSFTTAFGLSSTAMGSNTFAFGSQSTAMGDSTKATGFASTSIGSASIASGDMSTAIGESTRAKSYAEVVLGAFNTDYVPVSSSGWNSSDRLFVVGNGSSLAPSNALTLLKSGYLGIGTDMPSQKLHVSTGNALFAGSTVSNAGIEILPRLTTSNSGGRIFFREFNSDNFGVSLGFNGANVAGQLLNWAPNSFHISTHNNDPNGRVAFTITKGLEAPDDGIFVGIKTDNPLTDFDVDGEVRVRTLSGNGVRPVLVDSLGNLFAYIIEELGSQSSSPFEAIPDASCTGYSNSLMLSGLPAAVNSENIRVTLNLDHTYLSDLSIFLEAPNGEILCLLHLDGASNDNLDGTTFSDVGDFFLLGSAPYNGIFKPSGDLITICAATSTISSFGEFGGGNINVNGVWTLRIYDNAPADVGVLKDWSVSVIEGNFIGQNNYVPKWNEGTLTAISKIYDNGNVGIGTSNPKALLDVAEDVLLNGVTAGKGNNSVFSNTAFGIQSLSNVSNGYDNVGVGYQALSANNSGFRNTAVGKLALQKNATGVSNTAIGADALLNNTSGSGNVAIGASAMENNNSDRNTAIGERAMESLISGTDNVAVGWFALNTNVAGSLNTAVGQSANSLSSNFFNSAGLGYDADPSASNTIHIGNTSVTSIKGQVSFTTYSDKEFKKDINENEVKGLEFINKLRPVTYNYDIKAYDDWKRKHFGETNEFEWEGKYDIEDIRFSGFIAQEVEKAAMQIGYEFSGIDKPKNEKDFYGLRYAEFVVPLVKAVQEQQEMIEELDSENDAKESKLDDQKELIDELIIQLTEQKTQLDLVLKRYEDFEQALESCCSSYKPSSNIQFDKASLGHNIPNPFDESTIIPYYIPEGSEDVVIIISDQEGKVIYNASITNIGLGKLSFSRGDLAEATYIYTLFIGGQIIDSKIMVIQ